jgi:hypothetical protein
LIPEEVVKLHSRRSRAPRAAVDQGRPVTMDAKKIVVYVILVFVLYVIVTNPPKAADYVQIGFEGISSAAHSIGDFMTWIADGGKN